MNKLEKFKIAWYKAAKNVGVTVPKHEKYTYIRRELSYVRYRHGAVRLHVAVSDEGFTCIGIRPTGKGIEKVICESTWEQPDLSVLEWYASCINDLK